MHSVKHHVLQMKLLHARDQSQHYKEMDKQCVSNIQSMSFLFGLVSFTDVSMLVVLPAEDQVLVERMMEDHGVDLD